MTQSARWRPITLSVRQTKAMDRVGGAELILPWPPGLPPGPSVTDTRDATPAEHRAAEEIIGAACRAADPVPIRSTVAKITPDQIHLRDRNWRPSPSGQYLIVLIIGRRWEHASSGR